MDSYPNRPSRYFCETGKLEDGELYNQDLHSYGETPQQRCSKYYTKYRGGKRRTRNSAITLKNKRRYKKSRKSSRR